MTAHHHLLAPSLQARPTHPVSPCLYRLICPPPPLHPTPTPTPHPPPTPPPTPHRPRRCNGPRTGVKTLDPADWAYRGDYDNSSTLDAAVAKGFNYHQGPEWVWPFGYFLRARLRFMPESSAGFPSSSASLKGPAPSPTTVSRQKAHRLLMAHLGPHAVHMARSLVGGLPELTNSNGAWRGAPWGW